VPDFRARDSGIAPESLLGAEPTAITDAQRVELSVVVPVHNGSQTIEPVVDALHGALMSVRFEIVLVNDGSTDESEAVCQRLVAKYPKTVSFVQLARNFGEHSAVLAGLRRTAGAFVATVDDDGQNPPDQLLILLDYIRSHPLDVVYGRYRQKQHNWFRNLGSRFTNAVASAMLKKPRGLYLSSFKIMSRLVVDALVRYSTPFPYLDGMILEVTQRLGQVEVEHRERLAGRSGYTLRKLIRLWSNMFLGYSIAPLRGATIVGLGTSALSAMFLVWTVFDRLYINPRVAIGVPTVLVCVTFFAGVQLFVMGVVGEYVGRVFLHLNGKPQFIVRYERTSSDEHP
jgi:undecaprenyl-phosphate 4-deoxy-4-formamido-L-arabinose transferase